MNEILLNNLLQAFQFTCALMIDGINIRGKRGREGGDVDGG